MSISAPAGYDAVRRRAGLFDFAGREAVRLVGPDRADYLNRMCTNEINALPVGAGTWAALLSNKGRILADVRILKREHELLLDVDPGLGPKVAEFLAQFIIADDCEVQDATAAWATWGLYGPQSAAVLERALGFAPPKLDHFQFVERGPLLVVRDEHFGEEGYWLWTERSAGPALGDALRAAGAEQGSEEALTTLRVEAGIPRYGVDMQEDTLVLEAGIDRAIHFHKGCYIGQEVVARATYRGHLNKKLLGFVMDGPPPAAGAKLVHEGKEVGVLTTVAPAPALGAVGALGYARKEFFKGGQVSLEDGRAVRVQKLPLHRGPFTPPDLPPVCE